MEKALKCKIPFPFTMHDGSVVDNELEMKEKIGTIADILVFHDGWFYCYVPANPMGNTPVEKILKRISYEGSKTVHLSTGLVTWCDLVGEKLYFVCEKKLCVIDEANDNMIVQICSEDIECIQAESGHFMLILEDGWEARICFDGSEFERIRNTLV